jgi:predicted O-methyltransferase YrrM
MDISTVLNGIKAIPSTTTVEECMLLYSYVKQLEPNAIIVELGTGLGRTTAAMAYACIGSSRKIYTIDNYSQATRFTQVVKSDWSLTAAQENLKRLNLDEHVVFLNYTTTDPALLTIIPTPIDMVFIDATHTYQEVVNDINFWKAVLRMNGIMCGHDWGLECSDGREVIKAVADTVLDPAHNFEVQHKIWKCRRYW